MSTRRPASPPAPEYQAAILGFYRKHACRLDPWPAGLERSFAEAGSQVYNTMNGASEFTVTGTLKTWDIMDRLPGIQVPTLLVGGRYDECTPGHLEEMHRRIAAGDHRGRLPPLLRRAAGGIQPGHQFIVEPNGPGFHALTFSLLPTWPGSGMNGECFAEN